MESLHTLIAPFRESLHREALRWDKGVLELTPRFPKGACRDSSYLLGTFLAENGHFGARFLEGDAGGAQKELGSHAWLKLDDWWIDITGSQFEEYKRPEILIAREDQFLSTWEPSDGGIADFRLVYDVPGYEHDLHAFESAYARVVKGIRA
ncbi:hypothetical protein [Pseudomonas kurunegalensis]|uniref:Uncharacterized protein n=1 Tax=Pseudomonas kurunegalensis TaxID=485880 RepID=A0ACC5UKP8_9PSED|nr:hypothetical protein [Pseudomonas kurunegalensis]MBV4514994.1 hypothetical protein [Pseudomonas kurunegalensis]